MLEVTPNMLRKMKQLSHEFLHSRTLLAFIVRQAGCVHLPFQVMVQLFTAFKLRCIWSCVVVVG